MRESEGGGQRQEGGREGGRERERKRERERGESERERERKRESERERAGPEALAPVSMHWKARPRRLAYTNPHKLVRGML